MAQPVVSLNIPPSVAHIVLDPVQNFAFVKNCNKQNLHVEKVVLFVQSIVAIAKLHPALKNAEVKVL